MNANPGTLWQYHSGGVIAVGGMIRRAVGGDFYKFARDNLFVPIGVTSQLWVYSPFGGMVRPWRSSGRWRPFSMSRRIVRGRLRRRLRNCCVAQTNTHRAGGTTCAVPC